MLPKNRADIIAASNAVVRHESNRGELGGMNTERTGELETQNQNKRKLRTEKLQGE